MDGPVAEEAGPREAEGARGEGVREVVAYCGFGGLVWFFRRVFWEDMRCGFYYLKPH